MYRAVLKHARHDPIMSINAKGEEGMHDKKDVPWKKTKTVRIAYEDHPMVSLQKAVNKLFDDFFMSFELMPLTEFEDLCAFVPRVDMTDDGQAVRISAELPGMEKDAIEVNVDSDRLVISGNKSSDAHPASMSSYCMERIFGNFNRTIPLPKGMDTSRARAMYRNGILTITIPRRRGFRPARRIKIDDGE